LALHNCDSDHVLGSSGDNDIRSARALVIEPEFSVLDLDALTGLALLLAARMLGLVCLSKDR
jgi:hypothetical protein